MSDLSILAGIIGSDGHLSKDRSTICVINKDEIFLRQIVVPLLKKYANKEGSFRFIDSGFGSKKFLLRACSAELMRNLNRNYNIPIGKKSTTIKPPNLTREEGLDFFRGWVAGDGSVTTEKGKPKIELWSKSEQMINWFKQVLDEHEIESRIYIERNKNEFILRVSKKQAVKNFYSLIEIPHPKKQEKLNKLCSSSSRIRTA